MSASNAGTPANRARRLISLYLIVSLATVLIGPAMVVYAAEDAVPPAEEATVTPAPVEEPPASEVALPVESPPDSVAVDVAQVQPAASLPQLEAGGVRVCSPTDGVYTAENIGAICEPVPDDFEVTLDAFTTSEGSFYSFVANYPVSRVVVCGPEGPCTFDLGGAHAFSWLHAVAAEGDIFPAACSIDLYFCEEQEVPGCLQIGKFLDGDRDGVRDDGEDMLSGWEFVVYDMTGAEVRRGVTDTAGYLRFGELCRGDYEVVEILQQGWTNTTPLRQTVTVCDGEWSRACFGNVPIQAVPKTGRLIIRKFYDADRNGRRDASEGLLAAWHYTISLNGDVVTEAVTGADGSASVELQPGTYEVAEVTKSGWTNTTAVKLTVTVSADTDSELWFGNVEEFLPFTPPAGISYTKTDPSSEPFLPFTGGQYLLVVGAAFVAGAAGIALRRKA